MLSINRAALITLGLSLSITANCPSFASRGQHLAARPNPRLIHGTRDRQVGRSFAIPGRLNVLAWKDTSDGLSSATSRRSLGGSGGGGSGGSGSGGSGSGGSGSGGSGSGGSGAGQSNGVWQLGGGAGGLLHTSPNQNTSTTNHINLSNGLINGVGQSNKTGSLKNSSQTIEHRNGGDPGPVVKSPGGNRWQNVNLNRGLTNSSKLSSWQNGISQSNKTGSLKSTNSTVDYRNGGDPSGVHKLPSGGRWSDITLKRGIVNSSQLNSWRNSVVNSSKQNSWVSNNNKLPNLNGNGNDIAIPEFNPNKGKLQIP
jgi:hypothetical protein